MTGLPRKSIYCLWDKSVSDHRNIQTWSSEIRSILFDHNQGHIFDPEINFCPSTVIQKLKESMSVKQAVNLKQICLEKPKLRTYVQFKDFGSIPSYILKPMSFICRKYLALTRLSNLAIRIETGRFERPKLDANLRFCPACNVNASIEDEFHFIFQCVAYNDLRAIWLSKLKLPENFLDLQTSEKLKINWNDFLLGKNQNNWCDIMLYSDVLKGGEMESAEISIETAQGISLAFEYDINLIPGAAIKPDGNCVIELVMDQMKRYVYYINDFKKLLWTLFPP